MNIELIYFKIKVSNLLEKGHKSVLSGLNGLMKEMKDENKLQFLRTLRRKMEDCLDKHKGSPFAYNDAFR
jgi:hypothetical protein